MGRGRAYANAATTAGTSSTSAATTTATARSTTARTLSARSLAVGTLSLLASRFGLAGKLDRDLAFQDLLARELSDGTLGLGGGREVDECVANGLIGTRVPWDRDGLAESCILLATAKGCVMGMGYEWQGGADTSSIVRQSEKGKCMTGKSLGGIFGPLLITSFHACAAPRKIVGYASPTPQSHSSHGSARRQVSICHLASSLDRAHQGWGRLCGRIRSRSRRSMKKCDSRDKVDTYTR